HGALQWWVAPALSASSVGVLRALAGSSQPSPSLVGESWPAGAVAAVPSIGWTSAARTCPRSRPAGTKVSGTLIGRRQTSVGRTSTNLGGRHHRIDGRRPTWL